MKTNNIWRFATILLLSLPVLQSMSQSSNTDLPVMAHKNDEKVFEHFETMASFSGGDIKFRKFLDENIRCPKEIKKARLRARVQVSFIIAKDGSVENVRAERTILKDKRGVANFGNSELIELCEAEAIRVIRMMPRWIPALNFGARPKVKFRYNIFFNEPQDYEIEKIDEIWDEKDLENYILALPPQYSWTSTEKSSAVTDEMKMEYTKPEGFCQVDSAESFKDYKVLRYTILSGKESFYERIGPFLQSDDGQVISFLQFAPLFSKDYVERISKYSGCFNGHYDWNENKVSLYTLAELLENYHFLEMQLKIQYSNRCYDGRQIGDSWRNFVSVYNTKEAREKFNASSAYSFSLPLRPEDCYKQVFKYVKVLLIQRKGRGYACIYTFYTDKAKENFDKYWHRIEKTLRFED